MHFNVLLRNGFTWYTAVISVSWYKCYLKPRALGRVLRGSTWVERQWPLWGIKQPGVYEDGVHVIIIIIFEEGLTGRPERESGRERELLLLIILLWKNLPFCLSYLSQSTSWFVTHSSRRKILVFSFSLTLLNKHVISSPLVHHTHTHTPPQTIAMTHMEFDIPAKLPCGPFILWLTETKRHRG